VQHAASAGSLGDSAGRVARAEKRDDTDHEVIEATEQSVLPFTHRIYNQSINNHREASINEVRK